MLFNLIDAWNYHLRKKTHSEYIYRKKSNILHINVYNVYIKIIKMQFCAITTN